MDRLARPPRRQSRRVFLGAGVSLAGLALVSGCDLIPQQARPPAKEPRVGWVGLNADPEARAANPYFQAFMEGMRALGWIEGETVIFEYRSTRGEPERSRTAVAELIEREVDLLIVPTNTPAVVAAREGTSTIPILFIGVADPVVIGLVASLARPGGNVTGFSDRAPSTAAKQVQLLKETLPNLHRLAILWQSNNPSLPPLLAEAEAAARSLGLDVLTIGAGSVDELEPAFQKAADWHADGLCIVDGILFWNVRERIVNIAASTRLPSIYTSRDYANAGGLISYGPSTISMFRRAPEYADKILRGTKPADLPVQGVTTYDVVVNVKTAQSLGLTMPQSVLAQATEIIR
jgi:putative ABC transport system substrate-binding protein